MVAYKGETCKGYEETLLSEEIIFCFKVFVIVMPLIITRVCIFGTRIKGVNLPDIFFLLGITHLLELFILRKVVLVNFRTVENS